MSIIIEPLGGLGNQLFVYSLGLTLSEYLGTDLRADLWRFHNYRWHAYELDTFKNRISSTFTSTPGGKIRHHWRKLPQVLAKCGVQQLPLWGRLVTERGATFDGSILGARDGSRLSGYFQSWRYFESTASSVIQEVHSLANPSDWFTQTSKQLSKIGDWTAVHVRHGNYSMLPKMGVLNDAYYQRAIGLIDQLYGKRPALVFSDQPEVVSKMQCFQDERFQFMNSPADSRPIETLLLMSQASAKIIGNSTFSWWAAFVGDAPDRTVIAPRPWLASRDYNERDLFPPNWFTIGY